MATHKTLSEELAELEKTNPDVKLAAERYDKTVDRILGRDNIARFQKHRAGECFPPKCEYRHAPEERETPDE